jgi:hypothetical protein
MSQANADKTRQLVRPTLDTKFHIDYTWWDRADRELEVYLLGQLCPEHRAAYADLDAKTMVDHVDPRTGEVKRVLGIQHALITHCAKQPDYVTPQTSLVNAVFRLFLANGNTPLTPAEIGQRLGRSPTTILKTLSSQRVYKGIRPTIEG